MEIVLGLYWIVSAVVRTIQQVVINKALDKKPIEQLVKENMEKVIIGKGEVIELVITALVAGGHVLLEDMPGSGKTMLAKSLAE